MERRNFIRTMIGGTGLLVLPLNLKAFGSQVNHNIKFGACADVHQDVMHDEVQRMETFVAAAQKQKLDFIIQIGDFCRHYEYNQVFMDAWNSYPGDKYHVIGNHDMDGDFSREDVLKYWDISHKYYSFDQGGFHIIVLDGNDKNPFPNKASGYARFIGNKQLKWLEKDLKSTNLPCLIFSHQTLDNNKDGIENRDDIRQLFKKENEKSGFKKVVACFSGHHHTDYATSINDIYYIQINSMSYEWLGGDYKKVRYSQAIDESHEWIKYTVPYKEPLFAFIEIDNESIRIKGVKSSFVGPSPKDLGYPERPTNNLISPSIADKILKL